MSHSRKRCKCPYEWQVRLLSCPIILDLQKLSISRSCMNRWTQCFGLYNLFVFRCTYTSLIWYFLYPFTCRWRYRSQHVEVGTSNDWEVFCIHGLWSDVPGDHRNVSNCAEVSIIVITGAYRSGLDRLHAQYSSWKHESVLMKVGLSYCYRTLICKKGHIPELVEMLRL